VELEDFLNAVITTKEGWLCLAIGKSGGITWFERFYRWPAQRQEIVDAVKTHRGDHNIYFSAYLYDVASSKKSAVLPSRTIQADLDAADLASLPVRPSIVVQTSPGRHQAYWLLREELPLEIHEELSRRLTYAIPKCDVSGWWLGHKVRIPETFNFKYLDGPHPIEVIDATLKLYENNDFETLPELPPVISAPDIEGFLNTLHTITAESIGSGPLELLNTIGDKLSPKTVVLYSTVATDRSEALWHFMCQCFARAGMSREQVFFLAKHSKNNKFADLRHNADVELAKDVLRAEASVRQSSANPREVIMSMKKGTKSADRKPEIAKRVLAFMRERGTFFHTVTDATWYIRTDIGRPIMVSEHSDYLNMLLDLEYSLNATESDQGYTVSALCSYARNLPQSGIQSALSYYDPDMNIMLLHLGRRDVLKIGPDKIDKMVDGSNGVLFPWAPSVEPFVVDRANPDLDWAEHVFGMSAGQDALSNLINLKRDQGLSLLRVWFLFMLFRNIAISRPLLACLGQPGSGKSTLFRKLFALMYGRFKGLTSVTTQDDFDHSVATDPFVVLDNVDSPASWLPDRLALSASVSDIIKRRLYTDVDVVIMKRQACVGITAHNPRFGREDVADRMLIMAFERLDNFLSEQVIVDYIAHNRSKLWGGIVSDIQTVISTPIPIVDVQFRIEDFARLGVWISRALGIEDQFVAAITEVRFGQRSFSLEEDAILVTALREVVTHNDVNGWAPSKLWGKLELASTDRQAFVRQYRSSTWVGKKLLALQDALQLSFNIEWEHDRALNAKLWTISLKGGNNASRIEVRSRNGATGTHTL